MSAPAQNAQPAPGPINDRDVEEWKSRINVVLAQPADVINSKSPEGAGAWYSDLFGCFDPIDLCLMSWCLPCVTFGKTHHRLRKDANLQGYEPINTSCLLFCGASCVGFPCVPTAMQRSDIREKFHLEGNCLSDLAISWCCGCCTLAQMDKEVAYRQLNGGQNGQTQQYQPQNGMAYPEQK